MQQQERVPTSTSGIKPGEPCAIGGLFAAAMAIWIVPFVLAPIGALLGAIAWYQGERRARWIIPLAVVCLILGLIVHAMPARWLSDG